MKALMTSTAALAVTLSFAGSAAAQSGSPLSETSLRPGEITCQDLMTASEEERAGLVYFIAGYQAAMQQGGWGAGGAETTGSIGGSSGSASGASTDASGSAGGGTATAAAGTSTDASGGASGGTTATTGGSTDTAAAGSTDASGGASGGTTATTGGSTEVAAAGSSGNAGGGLAAGGASGGGDVQVSRAFFATPVSDILTGCENNATMNAVDVIGGAQSGAQ